MKEKNSYYLIGICGIGMSSLAQLIKSRGFDVRGSDANPDYPIESRLESLGIQVYSSHQTGRIKESDTVIYSTAVAKDNPEYLEAENRGSLLLHRMTALAGILENSESIVVTGTHGKTTTTYLLASVLNGCGSGFGMLLGGISKDIDNNFIESGSRYILELDESDGSFNILSSKIRVFTSLDNDHLEFYGGDISRLSEAFKGYMQRDGINIISADDEKLLSLARKNSLRHLSFGFSAEADYRGELIDKGVFFSKIRLYKNSRFILDYTLPIIGYKNGSNSLAVFALADILNLDLFKIAKSFRGLKGVERRYDLKFSSEKISIIEDYAHHPKEIEEVIKTARDYLNPGRVIVVFQPHRYTRTELLWDDYKSCFKGADRAYISDIYSAFEDSRPNINSRMLVKDIGSSSVKYAAISEIEYLLFDDIKRGDLLLVLGAGDINRICPKLIERLS
jgi:UDP-N-acetylmuramate--alanine ligase